MSTQNPNDPLAGMTDGRDDPNRGPLDRAQNALDGRDDPNRGPLDRAENAIDGKDDPNRGPRDRTANAMSGTAGGVSGTTRSESASSYSADSTSKSNASAVFDSQEQAQRAVEELRAAGIDDTKLSLIAQSGRTTTTTGGDGEVIDEEHGSILRGILGGGALGAGLGIAALAIPGVGPLVAAGAIASTAIPGAAALGAVAGAAVGTLNEVLNSHGVSEEDSAYYGDRIKQGGTFVSVDSNSGGVDTARAQEILYSCGGHSASSPRA